MKRQPIEWEKIFANDDWLGVNIQNVLIAHINQYQKNKKLY